MILIFFKPYHTRLRRNFKKTRSF